MSVSLDSVREFLLQHGFTLAEAALRNELNQVVTERGNVAVKNENNASFETNEGETRPKTGINSDNSMRLTAREKSHEIEIEELRKRFSVPSVSISLMSPASQEADSQQLSNLKPNFTSPQFNSHSPDFTEDLKLESTLLTAHSHPSHSRLDTLDEPEETGFGKKNLVESLIPPDVNLGINFGQSRLSQNLQDFSIMNEPELPINEDPDVKSQTSEENLGSYEETSSQEEDEGTNPEDISNPEDLEDMDDDAESDESDSEESVYETRTKMVRIRVSGNDEIEFFGEYDEATEVVSFQKPVRSISPVVLESELDRIPWPSGSHLSPPALQNPAVIASFYSMPAPPSNLRSFYLPVIFEPNKTGYEPSSNFPIRMNDLIANRYKVMGKLGSAAFSDAIQCEDVYTGTHVCVKIIKKHKDLFMGLDEIKLLRFLNSNAGENTNNRHVVQLLDYFFYKEHIFLVSELLKYNLYEYSKLCKKSGDAFFTLDRVRSIAVQVLDTLEFIHGFGLIHADLKPENILFKSCSNCLVRVIDFGSSFFLGEELTYYVQSRSYRAPEVILGIEYDQKIDMWSLGCILAEILTGRVLFPNNSVPVLLSRVESVLGQFEESYLKRGKYSHKFFTKDRVVFEEIDDEIFLLYSEKSNLKKVLEPYADDLFLDFLYRLLELDPVNRISASEAKKHPWILNQ